MGVVPPNVYPVQTVGVYNLKKCRLKYLSRDLEVKEDGETGSA